MICTPHSRIGVSREAQAKHVIPTPYRTSCVSTLSRCSPLNTSHHSSSSTSVILQIHILTVHLMTKTCCFVSHSNLCASTRKQIGLLRHQIRLINACLYYNHMHIDQTDYYLHSTNKSARLLSHRPRMVIIITLTLPVKNTTCHITAGPDGRSSKTQASTPACLNTRRGNPVSQWFFKIKCPGAGLTRGCPRRLTGPCSSVCL